MAYAAHPKVEYLMAAGGIRSGKSITLSTVTILRALSAAGSRHAIFHAQGNICKRNILDLTLPETFEILIPGYWAELQSKGLINITDRVVTLPNGSKILLFGLDDANKIRGQQFSTVWVNEANRGVTYDDITTLQGRLSETNKFNLDGSPLDHKFFIDLNPEVKSSWEYELFVEGLIPGDRSPLPNRTRYKWVHINPADNVENLTPGYFERTFAAYTSAKRQQDEFGLWAEDNPNALFDLQKIGRKHAAPEDMACIVVSIDPAGTANKGSDLTGIVVAGKGHDGAYYVFADETLKAKPDVWLNRALKLREDYDANWILSEKDYARDILEELIYRVAPNAPVKYVESRGRKKRLRAEPVAAMYEQGLVHHVPNQLKPTQFRSLELQMVEFDSPGFKGSPDRVDALVYALAFLSEQTPGPSPVITAKAANFWRV